MNKMHTVSRPLTFLPERVHAGPAIEDWSHTSAPFQPRFNVCSAENEAYICPRVPEDDDICIPNPFESIKAGFSALFERKVSVSPETMLVKLYKEHIFTAYPKTIFDLDHQCPDPIARHVHQIEDAMRPCSPDEYAMHVLKKGTLMNALLGETEKCLLVTVTKFIFTHIISKELVEGVLSTEALKSILPEKGKTLVDRAVRVYHDTIPEKYQKIFSTHNLLMTCASGYSKAFWSGYVISTIFGEFFVQNFSFTKGTDISTATKTAVKCFSSIFISSLVSALQKGKYTAEEFNKDLGMITILTFCAFTKGFLRHYGRLLVNTYKPDWMPKDGVEATGNLLGALVATTLFYEFATHTSLLYIFRMFFFAAMGLTLIINRL